MRTYFSNNTRRSATLNTGVAFLTLAVLSACGGGGDDSSGAAPDSSFAKAETSLAADEIVRDVAGSVSNHIGVNLESAAAVVSLSSAFSSFTDSGLIVQLQSDDSDGDTVEGLMADATSDSAVDSFRLIQNDVEQSARSALDLLLDDDSGSSREDTIQQMLLPTVGIGGTGLITKSGNTISIDPDESLICDEWLADSDSNTSTHNECTSLLSHLTVQIDSQTDDSGLLTYIFSGKTVAAIEYSPSQGGYEVSLPGVKTVLEQLAADTTTDTDLPDVMQGSIKMVATVTNDTPGSEAGSLSLAITRPLLITDSSSGDSLELDVSPGLTITADAATGQAAIAMEIVGLSTTTKLDDEIASSPMINVQVPAFTMNAAISGAGDTINISDFGLGRGPLKVAVDGTPAMEIFVPPFAISHNAKTGFQQILQKLDLDININELKLLDDSVNAHSSAFLAVDMPVNTVFHDQSDGSTKVISGGPVLFDHALNDGELNPAASLSISAGQCYSTEDEDSFWVAEVACN